MQAIVNAPVAVDKLVPGRYERNSILITSNQSLLRSTATAYTGRAAIRTGNRFSLGVQGTSYLQQSKRLAVKTDLIRQLLRSHVVFLLGCG